MKALFAVFRRMKQPPNVVLFNPLGVAQGRSRYVGPGYCSACHVWRALFRDSAKRVHCRSCSGGDSCSR